MGDFLKHVIPAVRGVAAPYTIHLDDCGRAATFRRFNQRSARVDIHRSDAAAILKSGAVMAVVEYLYRDGWRFHINIESDVSDECTSDVLSWLYEQFMLRCGSEASATIVFPPNNNVLGRVGYKRTIFGESELSFQCRHEGRLFDQISSAVLLCVRCSLHVVATCRVLLENLVQLNAPVVTMCNALCELLKKRVNHCVFIKTDNETRVHVDCNGVSLVCLAQESEFVSYFRWGVGRICVDARDFIEGIYQDTRSVLSTAVLSAFQTALSQRSVELARFVLVVVGGSALRLSQMRDIAGCVPVDCGVEFAKEDDNAGLHTAFVRRAPARLRLTPVVGCDVNAAAGMLLLCMRRCGLFLDDDWSAIVDAIFDMDEGLPSFIRGLSLSPGKSARCLLELSDTRCSVCCDRVA